MSEVILLYLNDVQGKYDLQKSEFKMSYLKLELLRCILSDLIILNGSQFSISTQLCTFVMAV